MAKNKTKVTNLVIGSDGFVGTALCAFLEKKGEEVIRFDIKRGEKEDARTAKLPIDKVDKIYFLAWEVGGAKYLYRENTQLHQLNWNIDLLKNVMDQLQKAKKPFIFVSSQLAEETDTVYGSLKRLGELWTEFIGGSCIRLWNVYGVFEEMNEKSHVAGDFVYQALTTKKIEMLTTGEEERQFIHTYDVCEGIYYVLENKLTGRVYDLTSFEWTSVRHMADLIAKHTGATVIPGKQKGSFRRIAVLKGRPPGWTHKISFEDGIKILVDHVKKTLKK